MITITKTCSDGLLDTFTEFERNSWIHLTNPTREEVASVSQNTGVPAEIINVALDPEEFAHTDIEDGNYMVVLDIPVIDKEKDVYVFSTIPIGLIYNKDYFISVCLKENSIIKDMWSNRVKGIETCKQVRLLLQIIQRTVFKYLQYLKRIDKNTDQVQVKLQQSVENSELFELLDIEKSLVYFATSLTGNDRILSKIYRSNEFKKFEEDEDLLDDVINDNKQAIEMCSIYRNILSGTMDVYASVISNNLNIIMKTLTLITIILTIPTVLASLWGMNVPVPLAHNINGFWLICIISLILALVSGILLNKFSNSMGIRRRKKK